MTIKKATITFFLVGLTGSLIFKTTFLRLPVTSMQRSGLQSGCLLGLATPGGSFMCVFDIAAT